MWLRGGARPLAPLLLAAVLGLQCCLLLSEVGAVRVQTAAVPPRAANHPKKQYYLRHQGRSFLSSPDATAAQGAVDTPEDTGGQPSGDAAPFAGAAVMEDSDSDSAAASSSNTIDLADDKAASVDDQETSSQLEPLPEDAEDEAASGAEDAQPQVAKEGEDTLSDEQPSLMVSQAQEELSGAQQEEQEAQAQVAEDGGKGVLADEQALDSMAAEPLPQEDQEQQDGQSIPGWQVEQAASTDMEDSGGDDGAQHMDQEDSDDADADGEEEEETRDPVAPAPPQATPPAASDPDSAMASQSAAFGAQSSESQDSALPENTSQPDQLAADEEGVADTMAQKRQGGQVQEDEDEQSLQQPSQDELAPEEDGLGSATSIATMQPPLADVTGKPAPGASSVASLAHPMPEEGEDVIDAAVDATADDAGKAAAEATADAAGDAEAHMVATSDTPALQSGGSDSLHGLLSAPAANEGVAAPAATEPEATPIADDGKTASGAETPPVKPAKDGQTEQPAATPTLATDEMADTEQTATDSEQSAGGAQDQAGTGAQESAGDGEEVEEDGENEEKGDEEKQEEPKGPLVVKRHPLVKRQLKKMKAQGKEVKAAKTVAQEEHKDLTSAHANAVVNMNEAVEIKRELVKSKEMVKKEQALVERLQEDQKRLEVTHDSLEKKLTMIMTPKITRSEKTVEKEKKDLGDVTKKDELWSKKRDEHKKLATDSLMKKKEALEKYKESQDLVINSERVRDEKEMEYRAAKMKFNGQVEAFRYTDTKFRASHALVQDVTKRVDDLEHALSDLKGIEEAEVHKLDEAKVVGTTRLTQRIEKAEETKKEAEAREEELNGKYKEWQKAQKERAQLAAEHKAEYERKLKEYEEARKKLYADAEQGAGKNAEDVSDWAWNDWAFPKDEGQAAETGQGPVSIEGDAAKEGAGEEPAK